MWVIVIGLTAFTLGVFGLLVLLSPKGDERPLIFTCERCARAFGEPPLHPLPERYQEEDVCLCPECSETLENRVRTQVRETVAAYLGGNGPERPPGP